MFKLMPYGSNICSTVSLIAGLPFYRFNFSPARRFGERCYGEGTGGRQFRLTQARRFSERCYGEGTGGR